jgi:valyl-tRNA synthetase
LEESGHIEKIEDYTNKIGISERTKAVIEPKISAQWFLKMEEMVKPAIKAVNDSEIKFFPKHYINTYNHWLENIRDWNISRQLWWGQQIPAFFYGNGVEDYVIAKTKEEALPLAKKASSNDNLNLKDLRQENDVLDTWFSSWLWPMSVFDGVRNPDNKDIQYYYPTNDLVTAPDIIFFWVARMIFAGYEFKNQKPFSNVYFTGIVRDMKGRKMSKSLGNSPDPIRMMEEHGADGVRAGLLLSSAAGNDLLFDIELVKQGKGFANKIWNGFRLIKGWEADNKVIQPKSAKMAIKWYEAKFQQALESIEESFEQYRLSEALMTIYKLLWDDFSSWYLEMVKPAFGEPIDAKTLDATNRFFEDNMKILHPFMPFITEEIWQYLGERSPNEALIVTEYPKLKAFDSQIIVDFETIKEVVSGIRTIRKDKNISFKNTIDLVVMNTEKFTSDFDAIVSKMGNVESMSYVSEKIEAALSFRVKSNEYFIPMSGVIDTKAEKIKLQEELKYIEGFLKSVQGKLKNERFVNNAPEKVVAIERQKEAEAMVKIEALNRRIISL